LVKWECALITVWALRIRRRKYAVMVGTFFRKAHGIAAGGFQSNNTPRASMFSKAPLGKNDSWSIATG